MENRAHHGKSGCERRVRHHTEHDQREETAENAVCLSLPFPARQRHGILNVGRMNIYDLSFREEQKLYHDILYYDIVPFRDPISCGRAAQTNAKSLTTLCIILSYVIGTIPLRELEGPQPLDFQLPPATCAAEAHGIFPQRSEEKSLPSVRKSESKARISEAPPYL